MKKILFILLLPILLFSEIFLGGFLELEKDVLVGFDNNPYYPLFNTLRVEGRAGKGNVRGLLSIESRFYDFTEVGTTADLTSIEKLVPADFYVYEAYLSVTGFILDNLDLKVGRQRIPWGTADRFNPTDNVNPVDLSNPYKFGENIPTLGVLLNYYAGDWVVSAVGIPGFTSSLLPSDTLIFQDLPKGDIYTPKNIPENGCAGLKISTYLLNFDLSLSYLYRYDDLPALDSMGFRVHKTYGFNREHILGFDFSGELFSAGIWGEFAYFIPDRYPFRIKELFFGDTIVVDTAYLHDPYIKMTLGLDYTFPGEIYANLQYVHGMDFERDLMVGEGKESTLGNYLIMALERDFTGWDLKFSLNTLGEMRDDLLAYGVLPEIVYSPYSNMELTMGYLYTGGDRQTFFGNMQDYSVAYMRFRFDF